MDGCSVINTILEWLNGSRDESTTKRMFEEAERYLSSQRKHDVSENVVSRTYSKGTKNLKTYGYYTKSRFHTECVRNAKRGRLVQYKPQYKPGVSYDYEYGFDAEKRLISTRHYGEANWGCPQKGEAKEYRLVGDTTIWYYEEGEIAFNWNMGSTGRKTFLELAVVTISEGNRTITAQLDCSMMKESLECYEIDIWVYEDDTGRIDWYTLFYTYDWCFSHRELQRKQEIIWNGNNV